MSSRSPTSATMQAASRRDSLVVVVSLAAGWVWLVSGLRLHEMLVGGLVLIPSTLFLRFVQKSTPEDVRLRLGDVAVGWRIPWDILTRIWEITIVLLKDLVHLHRAGSFYRVCAFETSKRDHTLIGREVLATLFTTAAPNFIVIGIDPETNQLLFHQIERTTMPKMIQALGAQS